MVLTSNSVLYRAIASFFRLSSEAKSRQVSLFSWSGNFASCSTRPSPMTQVRFGANRLINSDRVLAHANFKGSGSAKATYLSTCQNYTIWEMKFTLFSIIVNQLVEKTKCCLHQQQGRTEWIRFQRPNEILSLDLNNLGWALCLAVGVLNSEPLR